MEQKDFIGKLKETSNSRNELVERIQVAYESWMAKKSEEGFETLLALLDAYCGPWVRSELRMSGCYSDEEEHAALQESRLAVWKRINQGNPITEGRFAYLAFGIYKNKTHDVIRKFCSKRKKYGDIDSLDRPKGERGTPLGWDIPGKRQSSIEDDEQRNVYRAAFAVYCGALTDSSFFPPSCLALFYSRICPHVLSIYHSITTIPDSKGASAKWAVETMKGKTVGCLANSSEQLMQKEINGELHWGTPFSSQLGNLSETSQGPALVKDIVYTAEYSKEKTEDWAEYTHKVILKETLNRIVKAPSLCGKIREYAEDSKFGSCLGKGGITR